MTTRGSVELSINTFVVVLISLVILVSGIAILYKFIAGAEELKTDLDTRTEEELERLLVDEGKPVALPLHSATIERGSNHVFGLGIRNIGDSGNQFTITIEPGKYLNEQNEDSILTDPQRKEIKKWLLFNQNPIDIKEGEHHKEGILVHVPEDTPRGTYTFSVIVKAKSTQYGNSQRIYVQTD